MSRRASRARRHRQIGGEIASPIVAKRRASVGRSANHVLADGRGVRNGQERACIFSGLADRRSPTNKRRNVQIGSNVEEIFGREEARNICDAANRAPSSRARNPMPCASAVLRCMSRARPASNGNPAATTGAPIAASAASAAMLLAHARIVIENLELGISPGARHRLARRKYIGIDENADVSAPGAPQRRHVAKSRCRSRHTRE